jgi:predicted nuclease of predicted toxin-antitoxin system
MKLLIDMNLSPRWVDFLSGMGIEAVHWSSIGASNAPDKQIMAFAREYEYVVLTHDLDFGAILAATQGEKPSVVQLRADNISPSVAGSQVVAALQQMATELDQGALITVDTHKTRLRVLPLRTSKP